MNPSWLNEPLSSRPGMEGCHTSRCPPGRFPAQGQSILGVRWRRAIGPPGGRWLLWIGRCGGPRAPPSGSKGHASLRGLGRRGGCGAQFVLASHRGSACLRLGLPQRPARHLGAVPLCGVGTAPSPRVCAGLRRAGGPEVPRPSSRLLLFAAQPCGSTFVPIPGLSTCPVLSVSPLTVPLVAAVLVPLLVPVHVSALPRLLLLA